MDYFMMFLSTYSCPFQGLQSDPHSQHAGKHAKHLLLCSTDRMSGSVNRFRPGNGLFSPVLTILPPTVELPAL